MEVVGVAELGVVVGVEVTSKVLLSLSVTKTGFVGRGEVVRVAPDAASSAAEGAGVALEVDSVVEYKP